MGFRKLNAWQSAYDLTLDIYKATKSFPKNEAYGLTAQLQRAAVSIPANIAEGYERNHRKEHVQFLSIANGSLGETETYLLLAKDLGYLSPAVYDALDERRKTTSRLLNGLMKSLA